MAERSTPVEERLAEPPPPRQQAQEPLHAVIAGQYRIEEKIGDGGMGTVYKCTDVAVNRTVAVKLLHPHLIATSKWFLRFQQEAKAIARLQHPNIINMHHFSPDDDAPFIVMDYVSGWSLSEIIASSGKLSIERTLKLMIQVADALGHAHANGVVHRDLKPSNIMVLDGTDDQIKILDFGIAQVNTEQSATVDPVKLTQTGEVFGSPAYMSPEQCEGKKTDARSDQYSLGCVIFECLTGTPPFAATSSIHVMMQQINEVPPTLKEASLGQTFPENLEYAAGKLLAKNPADRFADMDEVVRTLRGRPVSQSETPPKHSKHKIYAAVACAVVLVLGILIGFAIDNKVLTLQQDKAPSVKPTVPTITEVIQPLEVKANLRLKAKIENQTPNVVAFSVDEPDREITDEALMFFARLPELGDLDLSGCLHIGDDGMKNLVNDHLSYLSILGLESTKIGNQGIKYIVQFQKLVSLRLSDTAVTDDDVALLKKLPHLASLNLSDDWQLTGKALNSIKQFPSLTRLVLKSDVRIVDGIKHLASTNIQILDLKDTPVRDEQLPYLAQMKNLKQLNLSKTNITQDSFKILSKMQNLEKLNLDHCENLPRSAVLKLKSIMPNWKSEQID